MARIGLSPNSGKSREKYTCIKRKLGSQKVFVAIQAMHKSN